MLRRERQGVKTRIADKKLKLDIYTDSKTHENFSVQQQYGKIIQRLAKKQVSDTIQFNTTI